MSSLSALIAAIVADGIVDAGEVTQIRTAALADGVVDTDEVKDLFAINDAVANADNDATWNPTFVELVSGNILADGAIDQEETDLLVDLIGADGQVCGAELALLQHLEANCEGDFPAQLKALMA
jgi:hypothetical protein